MATNKNTNIFAEPVEDSEVIVAQPTASQAGLKRARVRGTWLMHWGEKKFNFEDGKTYHIPVDLYEHLKKNGNIYDTL